MKTKVLAILIMAVFAITASFAADLSYSTKIYMQQGGEQLVVGPGGVLNVEGLIKVHGASLVGGAGDTYYVDPEDGVDTNDGSQPSKAFLTLSAALAACEDEHGDIIVRLPGTEEVAAAVTVNKSGVTIIAGTYGTNSWRPEFFTMRAAAGYTTGPVLTVIRPCAIIGMTFNSRCATTGSILIHYNGADYDTAITNNLAGAFVLLGHCSFPGWTTATYGIELRGAGYCRIDSCEFDGLTSGVWNTPSAVNNCANNTIAGCWFVDCTNGIEHRTTGTPCNFVYTSNRFVDYTDAIDFNNVAANGLVCDNYFETATDAATYDITVAAAQAHGVNFSGNHYSE